MLHQQARYNTGVSVSETNLKAKHLIINDFPKIEKAILRSQRCQRNWDLSKQLSEEQLEIILTAATECPTKQNIPFYSVHVVQNREVIEAIYHATSCDDANDKFVRKNPQVLANTLFVFSRFQYENLNSGYHCNELTKAQQGKANDHDLKILEADLNQAIGITSGYVNLVASMIGLQTGCCKCFEHKKVAEILKPYGGSEEPLLLMGIGFADKSKNRREDHDTGNIINSNNKKIEIRITR